MYLHSKTGDTITIRECISARVRYKDLNHCSVISVSEVKRMYHPPRRPLSGYGDITITRGAFLRSSKHWLVVARRLPSQTTGDLDGYPKITVVTRRRFSQTTETLDGHPKVTELTCSFSVALFILSRLRYQQSCFMYDQISIIIKQITKPCIYR